MTLIGAVFSSLACEFSALALSSSFTEMTVQRLSLQTCETHSVYPSLGFCTRLDRKPELVITALVTVAQPLVSLGSAAACLGKRGANTSINGKAEHFHLHSDKTPGCPILGCQVLLPEPAATSCGIDRLAFATSCHPPVCNKAIFVSSLQKFQVLLQSGKPCILSY